jgi:hypothetical protein
MTRKVEFATLDCPPHPRRKVIARVRTNDMLDALVEFRGTTQKGHFVVSRFERGIKVSVACFPTIEEGVAFA